MTETRGRRRREGEREEAKGRVRKQGMRERKGAYS